MTQPQTLFEKIWNSHLVDIQDDGINLLYIDRNMPNDGLSLVLVDRIGEPDNYFLVRDGRMSTPDTSTDIAP